MKYKQWYRNNDTSLLSSLGYLDQLICIPGGPTGRSHRELNLHLRSRSNYGLTNFLENCLVHRVSRPLVMVIYVRRKRRYACCVYLPVCVYIYATHWRDVFSKDGISRLTGIIQRRMLTVFMETRLFTRFTATRGENCKFKMSYLNDEPIVFYG